MDSSGRRGPRGGGMPIKMPDGETGIILPSCTDRSDMLVVPIRVGVGMRVGGEAILCFKCGPDGSVYHPREDRTMNELRALSERLQESFGYDPADLTPEAMREFDAKMRKAFGVPPSPRGRLGSILAPDSKGTN